MGSLSVWHWLIVLAIIVLVFGTKKLKNIGQDMGDAVKNFKKALNDTDNSDNDSTFNNAIVDHNIANSNKLTGSDKHDSHALDKQ